MLSKTEHRYKINAQTYLKLLNPDDVSDAYVSWMNNYEIVKFTEQRYLPQTKENITKFVLNKQKAENEFLFGIFFENQHVGSIKLGPINPYHKTADVSFIIGRMDLWGKKIGTNALRKLIDVTFKHTEVRKITAAYYSDNYASGRIFYKCGFTIEATLPDELIFEGKCMDRIIVGLTKKNYNKV